MPEEINKTTHVYLKIQDGKSLSPRFQGPFFIKNRPSTSTLDIEVGSYADGRSRIERHHWKNCRPAYVRPGQQLGQRPKLGRPSLPTPQAILTSPDSELSTVGDSLVDFPGTENQNNSVTRQIQTNRIKLKSSMMRNRSLSNFRTHPQVRQTHLLSQERRLAQLEEYLLQNFKTTLYFPTLLGRQQTQKFKN